MSVNAPAPAESKQPTIKDHLVVIKDTLQKSKQNLLDLLPATLRSEDTIRRFLEGVGFSVWKNPDLALCDRPSLISAVIYCVRMGLEPGAEDGCALVPFRTGGKRVVTPIAQYKGLIKRAIDTRSVRAVDTRLVYENDLFEWEEGTDAKIVHKPTKLGQPRGDVVGCYTIYTLPDGSKKHFVMDKADVERIRNMAAAYKSKPNEGPWHDHFWAMGQKTCIRQGFKTIPVNSDLRTLLDTDARIEGGESLTGIIQEITLENPEDLPMDALPEPEPTQAQKLTDAIKTPPQPEAPPPPPLEGNGTAEVGKAAEAVQSGPLFDQGFKDRANRIVDMIIAKPVDWKDIEKWVGPTCPEEITATNIANLEAYVMQYDPARAKKARK